MLRPRRLHSSIHITISHLLLSLLRSLGDQVIKLFMISILKDTTVKSLLPTAKIMHVLEGKPEMPLEAAHSNFKIPVKTLQGYQYVNNAHIYTTHFTARHFH